MNADQFKQDMTVSDFVRAVLPSLSAKHHKDFCNPMELENSLLLSMMPYETKIFLFRNDERCEISFSHYDQSVKISARFVSSPIMNDDAHTLPRVKLNSIRIGRRHIAQNIYDQAFYAPGEKPGMLENFRNRAYGIRIDAHDLTPERLAATCAGLDYACMHLNAFIIPPMNGLKTLFSPEPLTSMPPIGAEQLRLIKRNSRLKTR